MRAPGNGAFITRHAAEGKVRERKRLATAPDAKFRDSTGSVVAKHFYNGRVFRYKEGRTTCRDHRASRLLSSCLGSAQYFYLRGRRQGLACSSQNQPGSLFPYGHQIIDGLCRVELCGFAQQPTQALLYHEVRDW